ncbi:hypothetical protein Tco_0321256 [Tanacetum coccineum]
MVVVRRRWRVEACEVVGRVDPVVRTILGVDRKIPSGKFSDGGWPEKWAAGGGESSPEIMGREREFMRFVGKMKLSGLSFHIELLQGSSSEKRDLDGLFLLSQADLKVKEVWLDLQEQPSKSRFHGSDPKAIRCETTFLTTFQFCPRPGNEPKRG